MSGASSTSDVDATLPGGETTSPTEAERRPLHRGDVLGRYVVLEPVGSGGMGSVYAAYDPKLDRRVALEILHEAADRSTAAATMREAPSPPGGAAAIPADCDPPDLRGLEARLAAPSPRRGDQ